VRADHFSPDIQELLSLLAKHDVRYLIVGGEAVILLRVCAAHRRWHLSAITAVDFSSAWPRRREVVLRLGSDEIPIWYIGLPDLIRNKRAVARDKDKDDLDYLVDDSDDA
jgi:hypothetical protein